jgi:hypothetical protein
MSTHDTSVVTKKRIHLHPDRHEFKVDLGEVLEFHTSKEFYYFEIEFDQPGPPGVGRTIEGTYDEPVEVRMPDEPRDFRGRIVFKKKDGTCEGDPMLFIASSCVGCH